MASVAASKSFPRWLRGELDRQGVAVRELGRRLDPANVERGRRNVNRYLNGTLPGRPMRKRIAGALGVTVSELPTGDDDEEDDPMASFQEALTALVRQAIREQVLA